MPTANMKRSVSVGSAGRMLLMADGLPVNSKTPRWE
jgi:hypothetical protein